jgi:hypothetical protein
MRARRAALVVFAAGAAAAAAVWWRRRAAVAPPPPVQLGLTDGSVHDLGAADPSTPGLTALATELRREFEIAG